MRVWPFLRKISVLPNPEYIQERLKEESPTFRGAEIISARIYLFAGSAFIEDDVQVSDIFLTFSTLN